MANDNISKYNRSLSPEESRAKSRKAGRRSGEVRRENKLVKERIYARINEDDWNVIIDNFIERAKVNTRDFEVLRDTIGQKPKESIGVDHGDIEIVVERIHND